MPSESIRSFVALPLSEEMHDHLWRVEQKLKREISGRAVRWVSPSKIHLTLFFLGDILPEQLPEIKEALAVVAHNVPPFTATVKGLGVFPHPGRPRVLWVGMEDPKDQLTLLHSAVNEALASVGFTPETRPFTPHLTVGRVRRRVSRADSRRIGEVMTSAQIGTLGKQPVEKLILFRSDLKPSGAEYTALAAFPLVA
jgi:2'-5' RNA ligase